MSKTVLRQMVLAGMCFGALLSTGQAAAVAGNVTGKVEFIRTHDGGQIPEWAPPRFWLSLKGVQQAGNCPKWVDGLVLFVANDQSALSIALAAQASGQELAVAFDDSAQVNSWCLARYITIGNPAPRN